MKMFSSRLAIWLVAGALLVSSAALTSAATGVLYVADLNGKLVRIDLATGTSSLVTSGGLLTTAVGIALETSTTVLVSNVGGTHSIVRVNLSSGAQTLVTSGNLLQNPDGLAYDPATGIVYVAQYPLANVVAVNVSTGAQTLVTQGGFLSRASWVTLGPDGMLYVTDSDGSKIVRVDKTTGAQSVVSSGNLIQFPEETTFGSDGLLYVADLDGKRVLKINVTTGVQTLVSQGGNLVRPIGLGFDAGGILYTSNADLNTVISVNPSNGAQGVYTSSFLSQPYGVLVLGSAPPPPPPPAAPASITASDDRIDGIDVRWNDAADESGYHLYRNGVSIATLGSNDTSYFDHPAVGQYQYCVDAFNLGGASAAVCDSGTRRQVFPAPRISFVKDLPNDQGGKVGLGWLASELEGSGGSVTEYRVWRRLPTSLYGAPTAALEGSGRSSIRMRPTSDGVTYWEAVATLPAGHLAAYGYTATTAQDSLPGSNPFTAFFVSALTYDDDIFYDSEVDSGYSVDNLAPASPTPFVGNYQPDGVHLHWGAGKESDLVGYRLYRGTQATFVPSPANLVVAQPDTGYVDVSGTLSYYYKLAAVDLHGNLSLFGLVSPYGPTAALATVLRADYIQGQVEIEWLVAANPGVQVEIYRRDPVIGWQHAATVNSADDGRVIYRDKEVTAGSRYGYRLGIQDGGEEVSIGEAWVDVPALQLALYGIRPNPGPRGQVSAALVLQSDEPASLEFYDVSGRRVLSQSVGGGAGYHEVRLGATSRLRAGIYVIKLTQGQRESISKIVLSP